MEKLSSAATVPQLIRNIIIAGFVFTDETLLHLTGNSKLFEKLRLFLVTCFLFFLRCLPLVVSPFSSNPNNNSSKRCFKFPTAATKNNNNKKKKKNLEITDDYASDSGIGRAIWQLLSAMNEIPVNSKKYEVVRSLTERLIDENHGKNSTVLLDLNRRVLNAAFRRTLNRLETAVERNQRDTGEPVRGGLNRVVRAAVRAVGDGLTVWGGAAEETTTADQSSETAEKLAAEVLWLTEKMSVYGFVDEAVENWASASNLAWLSLWSEPRLQSSIVQISALLFKEAKEIGKGREEEEGGEKWREVKKKMLMSWLPLLCRASNGADKPVLRTTERAELEKVLEKMISELREDEQEQVLSLWLQHYTHCSSSSDWPDLNGSYVRWCEKSRQLLLHCDDHHDNMKKS